MRREEVVAEAAITLLVERGMRGLTHRAVDEAAGLPLGSTSNLARTRAALLALTLAHLTELEERQFVLPLAADPSSRAAGAPGGAESSPWPDAPGGHPGMPAGPEELAALMAWLLHTQLTAGRRTTLARYELALEATRRPELREVYDRAGRRFRELAVAVLTAAGSPDPVRHGRQLVAYGEGVIFDAVAGAGGTPALADLRAGMREVLRGMLGPRPR
ncbi:TetR/AcrR family transcriptional regulator [Sphaerisporangium album]|uniref:TetR/AcrR family transcriptional regulator n=1 Tax=Sphaerisporangium album TaxID=509200 RepID=A0A367FA86_9ACTN|nr:TetR/AcrR family transcriptional regulator [Sphaerisporangium album]RCG27264.1 TetR/AcrR family transcriptional regulator [Sphaerisporangium album]